MQKHKSKPKNFYSFIWLLIGIVIFSGISSAGTLVNESGVYNVDDKFTKTSVSVGFDNTSDFNVERNVAKSAFNQITKALLALNASSETGGRILFKTGLYNVENGDGGNFLDLTVLKNKFTWLQGEGFGTIFIKNNSNSGLFALGNGNSQNVSGFIASDFQVLRSNATNTFRLFNGQPSSTQHNNVYIQRILSMNNGNSSSRWLDLDANNLHLNDITLYGQLRGGTGSRLFAMGNYVQGNENITGAEVECLDINFLNVDVSKEAFIIGNSLHDCYEQVIDNGNRFAHIIGNHGEVNTPTDQGGFTEAGDWSTVIGNTLEDAQNSRGGIEIHEGANFDVIIGNIILANHTNEVGGEIGTINESLYNSAAVGMRVDGENHTFIGNVFGGFNGTNIFQGAIGQDNQWIGNWFDPHAKLLEGHWGINMLGDPNNNYIKRWVIQGANVEITRNLSVNNSLFVTRRFNIAPNITIRTCGSAEEGDIYYDGSAKKHFGCNSTTWNALY